jgi:hypothetical protein
VNTKTAPSERYLSRNGELLSLLAEARENNNTQEQRNVTSELLVANDALVRHAAHRFGKDLPWDESYAASRRGLLRAIEGYDIAHGTTLATYAMWWMRKHIQTAYHDHLKHLEHRADLDPAHLERSLAGTLTEPADEVTTRVELERMLSSLTRAEHEALLRSGHHPLKRRARSKVTHPATSDLAGEWAASALCKGTTQQLVVAPRRPAATHANDLHTMCDLCPVRRLCASFADRHNLTGWWAGLQR